MKVPNLINVKMDIRIDRRTMMMVITVVVICAVFFLLNVIIVANMPDKNVQKIERVIKDVKGNDNKH